jgi:ribose transport system substrate-binding protein
MRDRSRKLISDFLDRHPRERHILIAAVTDTSALGALDAVRERKRDKHVAIVGQDCIPEAVVEMSKTSSALIGSVSHEAGAYGPALVHLGLSILRGQTVAPYNYVDHKMVTPESLARS